MWTNMQHRHMINFVVTRTEKLWWLTTAQFDKSLSARHQVSPMNGLPQSPSWAVVRTESRIDHNPNMVKWNHYKIYLLLLHISTNEPKWSETKSNQNWTNLLSRHNPTGYRYWYTTTFTSVAKFIVRNSLNAITRLYRARKWSVRFPKTRPILLRVVHSQLLL